MSGRSRSLAASEPESDEQLAGGYHAHPSSFDCRVARQRRRQTTQWPNGLEQAKGSLPSAVALIWTMPQPLAGLR